MKSETVKHFSDGAATLTGSLGLTTGLLKFLDHHAAGIGALCTIITLIVYITFQILSHRKLSKADENKKDIQKILDELKEMKSGK
tara:strand:+ start:6318 stop:6572 length:255 start_codon:yes stop_codon:yes gene_type:complete